MSFDLTQKVKILNPHADNDELYGPYESTAAALSAVVSVLREKGRTVGVINESGSIEEYWFKSGITDLDLVPKTADLSDVQVISEKGQANGYVPLDENVTIPSIYFPDSILGQMKYGGNYDGIIVTATADYPELDDGPLPDADDYLGVYFITTAPFTLNGDDYVAGDWIVSIGTKWTIVRNTDAVRTVFGRTGDVIITPADLNLTTNGTVLTRNTSGALEGLSAQSAVSNGSLARRTSTGQLKAATASANDDLVPLLQLNTALALKEDKSKITLTLDEGDLVQDENDIFYLEFGYAEPLVPIHISYNGITLLGWQLDRNFTPARIYGFINNNEATIKLTII